ncbi:MAG: hypothetical protein ABJH82_02015 [Polaribacter sp.]|uniref:helix-turn-helix transcriptional regulator n=1 Tax=Polaribacter sp. TaxID=1920175 RepID=UPI0032647EDE
MKHLRLIKIIIPFVLSILSNSFIAQEVLIKNEDSWHYYDQGYLENDWININNFSDWKKGKSPLGYGDEINNTEISFGKKKEKKHITKYFKKKIFINNNYIAYEIRLQKDDGAVVYVNGKEIFRDNMPSDIEITNITLSSNTIKGAKESEFNLHYVDKNIFNNGKNIISVEVHQAYKESSDCIFSLELIGHENPKILPFILDNKNKTNKDLEHQIKDLNNKFEYEKTLLQKESLEGTNYNLKFLVSLISILFIISLFGYYFIIENSKKKQLIKEKKINNLNIENLKKDKKIITLSTNLLHNKQYFKEIKADIKSLKTKETTTLKSIINQIDKVLESDDEWNTLKKHFNAVYDNFYDKLISRHPTITETELRHCMFIKLHLHTKEIAKILLIDPRSVQTGRYRIKKKMNLGENVDLRDYLLNLD